MTIYFSRFKIHANWIKSNLIFVLSLPMFLSCSHLLLEHSMPFCNGELFIYTNLHAEYIEICTQDSRCFVSSHHITSQTPSSLWLGFHHLIVKSYLHFSSYIRDPLDNSFPIIVVILMCQLYIHLSEVVSIYLKSIYCVNMKQLTLMHATLWGKYTMTMFVNDIFAGMLLLFFSVVTCLNIYKGNN